MARKTVEIELLRQNINRRLAAPEVDEAARKELCFLLETVLLNSQRYYGFSYIGGYQGKESFRRVYN